MPRELSVWMLPDDFEPESMRGAIAVVIDVLRASSTIVTALANGADCVIPCGEVAEARRIAGDIPADRVLLGGERGGLRIDGFDLDNSPAAYGPERVEKKTVVFTTTNGTAALLRAKLADRIVIGSLLNRRATVAELQSDHRPIHLVCAGTNGSATIEDLLGAGAIVDLLQQQQETLTCDDLPFIARELWIPRSATRSRLVDVLRRSRGGRNLVAVGLEADLARCAAVDSIDLVAEYFPADGRTLAVR